MLSFGQAHLPLPAASLHALALVAAPPRQPAAQKTPPGISHTHCSVHENFQLAVFESSHLHKVVKPALARGDNARNSRVPPELGGAGIGAVCLRRQVQRQAGRNAFGNLHNPGVADYESVRAAVVKRGNIIGKLFQISAVRKNIDGYVNLFPFFVRIAAAELDFVKSKIVGKGAQAEIFARQIQRVRSEVQRREKFFHIAGGSKQLGTARFLLVHNLNLNERIVVIVRFQE